MKISWAWIRRFKYYACWIIEISFGSMVIFKTRCMSTSYSNWCKVETYWIVTGGSTHECNLVTKLCRGWQSFTRSKYNLSRDFWKSWYCALMLSCTSLTVRTPWILDNAHFFLEVSEPLNLLHHRHLQVTPKTLFRSLKSKQTTNRPHRTSSTLSQPHSDLRRGEK
jgi:hypothetical protein